MIEMLFSHREQLLALAVSVFSAFSSRRHRFVLALDPLEIEGNKFFDIKTGEDVALKGVAYYPRPNYGPLNVNNFDFYTEEFEHVWRRDIEHFKDLGVNSIRLYAVDPSKSHDAFMCACESAGIYVIVGLSANCQDCAITNEEAPHCYPPGLKKRGQMIISQFAKYRNVLAFSAGNEVGFVSPLDHSLNAPCLKKFVRDMRSFVASCNNLRKIPVGLVVGDIQREEKLSYFSCQGDEDPYENAEWFGLNTYIHCDPRAFELDQALGLKTLRSQLEGIPIPFVMTEFGCLNQAWPAESGFQSQRTFLEAEWMFDPEENFREVIAGAFAFEYSTEAANLVAPYPYQLFDPGNYGLGYFSPENCDECWTSCTYVPKPEFENLKSKYAATPTRGVTTRDSLKINEDSLSFPVCPPGWRMISEFQWSADNTTVFFAKNKSEEVVQMTVSIKSNPAYGLCPPTESLTCKNSSTPSEYNTFSTPQACSGWIPPLEDDNGIVLVWTPPETPSSSGRPSSYVRNHEHQWWLTGAINIFLKFLL